MSAADANRHFSRLLREVRDGASCVITSHGRPVAKLVPVTGDQSSREVARSALVARLRAEPATTPVGAWTRDELYEDR